LEIFSWLQSFLSEPDGKGSSRRIIELLISWAFIFSYIRISLQNQTITDVPVTWAMLIAGILGLKTWDKYVELRNGKQQHDT
jgi:hypothetical protein